MSPTDEGGSTPESPETPEPNGDVRPAEPTPVDLVKASSDPSESTSTETGINKKVIAIIAAVVVAIVAISAILFVTLKDDDAPAPPKADTTNQSDTADEAAIKSLTEKFIETANTGKVGGVKDLVCQQTLDLMGDQLVDEPPADPALMISKFDKITVQGDRAIAEFTFTAKDQPGAQTTQAALQYLNEDGWKVCN